VRSQTGSVYNFRSQNVSSEQLQNSEHIAGDSAPVENEKYQPIGTSKSGYAPPSEGPFLCSNCLHYTPQTEVQGACDHPDVIVDAEAGEIPPTEGGALVEGEGCCNYYRPINA